MIDIPTRITKETISLFDLFYVQNQEPVVCHGTLPNIADHSGIFVSFYIDRNKQTLKTKTIFDYKDIDIFFMFYFSSRSHLHTGYSMFDVVYHKLCVKVLC